MQRDVKIGIAIGVLLIALIAVFWWFRHSNKNPVTTAETPAGNESGLPAPVVPVAPGMGVPGEGTGPMISATGPSPMMTGAAPMGTAAMPETTAVPPPAPVATSQTYKVQSGDSLSTIAQHFYGSQAKWHAIYDANKEKIGANPRNLKVGMELVIPGAAAATSTGSATATSGTGTAAAGGKYVVASGDTLTSIAQKEYGSASPANIQRIYQANKATIGSDPDDLKIGMQLVIPPAQ